jgi:hypothetical protein
LITKVVKIRSLPRIGRGGQDHKLWDTTSGLSVSLSYACEDSQSKTQKLEYSRRTTFIEEVPLVDALEPSTLEALRAVFVATKFCFSEPFSLFNLTI